jgi:hypothetical protein
MEQHTLIVGGTGMLKQVSIALAKRSRLLTSVARTAASLHKLDRELERGDGSHYMLQLDWSDGNFLDKLEAHCSAVGYPSLVVAWLHNDDLAPRIAARIGDAIESCRFFHVRSSAAADPNRGSERLAKAWAAVPVQQHEVILGFQITDSGSRWLDNSEISSGVITAIERGARKTVVGVVSPWANRP